MPAESIKLPRWLAPLIVVIISGISSVLYTDHNASIEMRSELSHLQKVLEETRREQAKMRGDMDDMRAESSGFHTKALEGINELIERGNSRGGRR